MQGTGWKATRGGGDFLAGLFHPSFHFDTPPSLFYCSAIGDDIAGGTKRTFRYASEGNQGNGVP